MLDVIFWGPVSINRLRGEDGGRGMGEGGESHCFHGVKEGGQSSQTEFKRSTVEKWLPMSGGGGEGGGGGQ